MDDGFAALRDRLAPAVDRVLADLLPESGGAARRLVAAMRYALMAGGKRIRPLLTVLCGRLFDVPQPTSLRIGAAVECLHTYSLIHDDLPAMDDALERRGRLALHRAFDEATAILAGDALQAVAFGVLVDRRLGLSGETRSALMGRLADAAGLAGMCAGQMLDLEAGSTTGLEEVRRLQALKTGALIAFACEAGAIAGGADDRARERLLDYGRALGAAFQIRDDLLDVTGDQKLMGKDLGRDHAQAKATFVSCLGIAGAEAELAVQVAQATAAVAVFGRAAGPLAELARYVAARTN